MSRSIVRSMSLGVVACAAWVALAASPVEAGILFFEDFEGYTSFTNGENSGLPLLSEGANETWYGGRMENGEDGSINNDVAVWRLPQVYPNNITFGQVEDDAGLLFKISTIGVNNPILEFEWKTHNTESTDRFVAGYYVGSIDFVNDTPDGANDNLVHRFNQDGPSWSGGGWVELLRDRDNTGWNDESYALPGNQAEVWVAFWMDNGEGDLGKVDNIVVSPEPATAMLLGMGLVTLVRRRSR